MDCVTCGASLAGYEGKAAHDQWHRDLIAMLAELRRHVEEIRAMVAGLEVGNGR